MKLVKPASNFARGKIEYSDKRLREWTLRGIIPLGLAAPIGLGVGFLDSTAGLTAGLVLGLSGLTFILIGVGFWFEAGNTRKGWEGETRVSSELSYLSNDFLLLNDVMLSGSHGNIDHVLVGPTGVFVFETKNYSGKYVCYGDRWFFQGIRQKYEVKSVSLQAKNNANIVGGLLHSSGFTIPVNPIIVFTHPAAQLWLHHPTVPVLKAGTLCNFVQSQKPQFSITAAYAETVANKILISDRTTQHAFQPAPKNSA